MTDGPRLYVRHLRQSDTCMKGARGWFAKLGWPWQDFIDNGRPLADFEATGCPLAQPAIESARKEAADGG